MKKTLIALLAVMLVAAACCAIASAEEYKCNLCGTPLTGPYDMKTKPTCCDYGYITFHCPNEACKNHDGGSFKVEPTGDHKYTEPLWDTKVDAKCGDCGKITYKCSTDGCKATKDFALLNAPLEHDFGTHHTIKAATCGNPGEEIYECTRPGCDFHKIEAINPTGAHDFSKEIEIQAASCKDGKGRIYYKVCKNCGAKDETSLESKPAPAHKWQFTNWKGEKENVVWNVPTCTAAGTSYNKCTECGLVETKTLPATGHKAPATIEWKWSWPLWKPEFKNTVTLAIKGDCLHRETLTYKCLVCEKNITETKNYGDHDWDVVSLDKTFKTRTCSICGRSQGWDAYNEGWVTTVKGKSIADNMKVVGDGNCDGSKSVNTKEKTSTKAAKASAASTKANASGVSIPKTNDNTSTLPYVMMGIALVGIVALIASKRKVNG